ncbi:MAG: histidine phosphatase family protein [Deltaproteobacteria bacterium]|nr:histidine phosphatase family protein [Deltaproteobacteria bacterium]
MLTYFALMRHAETTWNREKRIQGQQDAPLTFSGRQQAREWGCALARHQLDYMLASDLGRATHTATLINHSLVLPCSLEPRLREQDWGSWSGSKVSDLLNTSELKDQEKLGWDFRPLDGESRLEVLQRSRQALADTAQKMRGKRILVITHGGVIRCLLYRLWGRKFLADEPALIKPYRLHWLSYNGAGFEVQRLNEEI